MSSSPQQALTAFALFLAMTAAATAAESSTHACASVADPTQRLACYDAAFPPAGDAQFGAIVDPEIARAQALKDFGLNKAQLSAREPERMRELSPERIEATVAGITNRSTGERVLTLDNEQIWLLTEVTSKGRLRVGDRVVLRTAALGTYKLITPGRVPLRAKRIL